MRIFLGAANEVMSRLLETRYICRMTLRKAALLLLCALALGGCRKPSGANWDVDLLIPVANSRLNISNFIADTIFEADQAGLLHFRFNRELLALKLDTLVKLPDTTIKQLFVSPVTLSLVPAQTLTFFPPSELTFNVTNGIELTVAEIRQGSLTVTFSNSAPEVLDLIYQVPSAVKNGMPLTISESIPPGQNSLRKSYDLSGYRFSMRGMNGNRYNTIVQTYTVALNKDAQPVTVTSGQGASIEVGYSHIVPQYLEGWFGDEVLSLDPDTASFSFLDNVTTRNFMLSQAKMEFRIMNEFGADFEASLSGIRSINMKSGQSVLLNTDKLSSIHLDWAKRSGSTVTSTTKTILFDQTNSNITAFISNLPDRIAYQGSVQINPPPVGQAVGHTNYAYYDKGIRVLANIDIPMRFTADEISLESNAKVDLGNVDQLDKVNSGRFVITATNGYPFTAKLQAYMKDEAGVTIDSLFVDGANYIQHGTLNAQNEVTEPQYSQLFIPIDKQKIDNLRRCRSLRIVSKFLMPQNPPEIKILEGYEFDVKIVAELNYNVGIE